MNEDVAYRERVGVSVTKKLAKAMEDGMVTRSEAAKIARYILDNIDKAHSSADVVGFLSTLSDKWPFFADVLEVEEGARQKVDDAYSSEQVTDLIKKNKIEEALKMAEDESSNNSN